MTVEVLTFGCRLNGVESDAMRRLALAAGHADLAIVNSCAVTNEAVAQARQSIRRLKRERPHLRILVTGCAVETEPRTFADMPEVDGTISNLTKTEPATWAALRPIGSRPAEHAAPTTERSRAFVAVQTGCDHRCTFCIIPYGRGPSRSTPMGVIVDDIRRHADAGCGEVVLTGVDLTSYGADLPGTPTLGSLVRAILRHVPALPRLRLSSVDAVEADAVLRACFAEEARLMPHLHVSLQAGDDLILKRMKRRHGRADAIAFCADLRRLRPDMVFGADLIAGFPTEDEAMFARSLDLVEECGLTHLHVFPYSPRPGTPAARMPQVPGGIIRERARRLRAAGAQAFVERLGEQAGRRHSVLAERGGIGHTEGFLPVKLQPGHAVGTVQSVIIAGHDGRHLLAA